MSHKLPIVFDTSAQLSDWLEQNNRFADAILSYALDRAARQMRLDISVHVTRANAGESERVRLLTLQALDVHEIDENLVDSGKDLAVYYISPRQAGLGLTLDCWGHDDLSFAFKHIQLVSDREEDRIATPLLSESTMSFRMHADPKPSAIFWTNQRGLQEFRPVFIGYFGNEIPVEEVGNYKGLSLRPAGARRELGVNFREVVFDEKTVLITLDLQNSSFEKFWDALMDVISEIPPIDVRCGNVVFTANEWRLFRKTKVLPAGLLRNYP